MLDNWYAYGTHCHVNGTSQSGKSKFAEHCIREHIEHDNGVCLIDWHGTQYDSLIKYLAYVQPDRPIVLLDPSRSEYIMPFNPFALPIGREPSSHVNRLASLLVKPWGAQNTNELPTYERVVKMMLAYMAATGEPLHHAAHLLEFPQKELREWALTNIDEDSVKQQWKELQCISSRKEWQYEVLSTRNRLGRFLASRSILRFMGLSRPGLTIADCIRQKAVILINLKPSQFLDPESAKTFAALLLSEFLDAAMMNIGDPQPYFLYLDECQNYLTADAAQMLDQVLKSGLRMTLIHHDMGQFDGNVPLQSSLRMNARLKVLFAGASLEEAKRLAEEFFLAEANERWPKETKYTYLTDYYEDSTVTTSETDGESPSGSTHSETTTMGTRLVPFHRKVENGQEDWGRDEKIAQLAARLLSLQKGECYIKTPDEVSHYTVPYVESYFTLPDVFLNYEKSLNINAISVHEADHILKEAEARFFARGREYAIKTKARPAKKRHLSPPQ